MGLSSMNELSLATCQKWGQKKKKNPNLFPIFFGFPSFLAWGLQLYIQKTDVQFVFAVWLPF